MAGEKRAAFSSTCNFNLPLRVLTLKTGVVSYVTALNDFADKVKNILENICRCN